MALGRSAKHHVTDPPSPPSPRAADEDEQRRDGDPRPGEAQERPDPDPLLDTVSMQALPPSESDDIGDTRSSEDLPLLDDDRAEAFLDRWSTVQAQFVDDPQAAVRDGDALVTEVMQALSDRLMRQKAELEAQWHRGDEPHTEELRVALQQYRAFFQRLLAT